MSSVLAKRLGNPTSDEASGAQNKRRRPIDYRLNGEAYRLICRRHIFAGQRKKDNLALGDRGNFQEKDVTTRIALERANIAEHAAEGSWGFL
jgi:hypothetical protein